MARRLFEPWLNINQPYSIELHNYNSTILPFPNMEILM